MSIREKLLEPQNVWLAWIPFEEDETKGKRRPVVILEYDSDIAKVLILPITSAPPNNRFDVTVSDWTDVPLDKFSTIKTANFRLMPADKLLKWIGRLTDKDWDTVCYKFQQYIDES